MQNSRNSLSFLAPSHAHAARWVDVTKQLSQVAAAAEQDRTSHTKHVSLDRTSTRTAHPHPHRSQAPNASQPGPDSPHALWASFGAWPAGHRLHVCTARTGAGCCCCCWLSPAAVVLVIADTCPAGHLMQAYGLAVSMSRPKPGAHTARVSTHTHQQATPTGAGGKTNVSQHMTQVRSRLPCDIDLTNPQARQVSHSPQKPKGDS